MKKKTQIAADGTQQSPPGDDDAISAIVLNRARTQAKPAVRLARHVASSARNVMPSAAQAPAEDSGDVYQIAVISGKHANAVARVKKGPFTVGSDFANDVIITDADVAASHLEIAPGGGLLRTVTVKAIGPDVLVAGETVEEDESITAYLPVEIGFGGVRIRVSGTDSVIQPKTVNKKAIAAATFAVMASAAWLLFDNFGPDLSFGRSSLAGEFDRMIAGTDNRALNAASAALTDAALDREITVANQGGGLIAKGVVPSAKHAKWVQIKSKLMADGFQVIDQVHMSPASEPARGIIAAISLGDPPYVVTRNGKTVKIGEKLEGGWVIKELKPNLVVVERGSVRTTITP